MIHRPHPRLITRRTIAFGGVLFGLAIGLTAPWARGNPHSEDARSMVYEAERQRIEVIDRVMPSVVCVFDQKQRGGGSGVIIDPQGYGLTNFHVVAGMLSTRHGLGALSDGKMYDLEVLGIDPTGDVAMFRLLGKDTFAYAELGDSDLVRVGDDVMAMGNPFTLSEDYKPAVTVGLVTGVHRYQWGVGNNLVYSDCIQTDASINPGNSGGPLFNEDGEVIGLNGRISVNTRGRFNVGHGYAISSNQIRRFMPALRAGLIARHGTLQATVERVPGGGVAFDNVRAHFAADNAGVLIGDRLLSLDGVTIDNPNRFASVLGTYPAHWTISLALERAGRPLALKARLDPIEPELSRPFEPDPEINRRETSRVLEAYRRSVFGAEAGAALPQRLTWTMTRTISGKTETLRDEALRFAVTLTPGQSIQYRRIGRGGTDGRIIECNDRSTTQRASKNGDRFDLAQDEALVLRAVYLAQGVLLNPKVLEDRPSLTHAGGNALPVEWKKGNKKGNKTRKPGVLELINAPMDDGGSATFGFDSATGRLATIRVEDAPSGVAASVTFFDYQDFDGTHWPAAVRIELPDKTYHDRISVLEGSP